MMDMTTRQFFKNKAFYLLETLFARIYARTPESIDLSCTPHIQKIRAIFFELSNQCNYTYLHPKCPTNYQCEKRILSGNIFNRVIAELAENQFSGVISFHRYNEPLIDPRLILFIQTAKLALPNAYIRILTNGSYLTQEVADSLINAGVNWLEVSSYFKGEFERLVRLKIEVPYHVFSSTLDKRLDQYERESSNLVKPCYAMLNDITVNCHGELGLCCLDWKNQHTFGNLQDSRLSDLLDSELFLSYFNGLAHGKRELDLCSRCDWKR